MYYYIFLNKRVLVRTIEVDTTKFPQFILMNEEQINFYNEHPHASIEEIKQCELIQIERIPLDKYKTDSINALSTYSLNVSSTIIPDYKIQNAIVCLNSNCQKHIYQNEECQSILNRYDSIGKICRDMFYNFKQSIEECTTHEEVDIITSNAYNEYTTLMTNEKDVL